MICVYCDQETGDPYDEHAACVSASLAACFDDLVDAPVAESGSISDGADGEPGSGSSPDRRVSPFVRGTGCHASSADGGESHLSAHPDVVSLMPVNGVVRVAHFHPARSVPNEVAAVPEKAALDEERVVAGGSSPAVRTLRTLSAIGGHKPSIAGWTRFVKFAGRMSGASSGGETHG